MLVTGPTGSGKSTTLAAVLDRINKRLAYHVVTIEDPIEFVHTNDRAVFTQREIGEDVGSFAEGVKASIREDPDCLLVGEMRDLETIRMALTAAETGLLVFATLHTNSAAKAVDRIIDAFPAIEQEQIRTVLAGVLRAVVAQQLLRKKEKGRVRGLRGPDRLDRPLQRDPGREDRPDQQPDPDGKEQGDDLDGSVAERAAPRRRRRAGGGARARLRQGQLQGADREPSEGAAAAPRGTAGSRRMKNDPPPGRAATSTLPPCRSAMRPTIASPKPAPSGLVE